MQPADRLIAKQRLWHLQSTEMVHQYLENCLKIPIILFSFSMHDNIILGLHLALESLQDDPHPLIALLAGQVASHYQLLVSIQSSSSLEDEQLL